MKTLYSIGHSTRTNEEFFDILLPYEITHLVDVRTIPKSRRMPWFNKETFGKSCRMHNIHYIHMPALGGLRRTTKESINKGWHNTSFRGFADYMQTREFFDGLKQLNELLRSGKRVVIMCAEALPWRCHRSLIADAETVRGIKVWHIFSKTNAREHSLTSFAKIIPHTKPIRLYYPEPNEQLNLL